MWSMILSLVCLPYLHFHCFSATDTSFHSVQGGEWCSDEGDDKYSDNSFIVSDSIDVLGADHAAHTLSDTDDPYIEEPVRATASTGRTLRTSRYVCCCVYLVFSY